MRNLSSELNVYLKTTETCNLNCSHCFTSGSKGAKIFFSPERVVSFFTRMAKICPWVQQVRFNFHGGEPMLAPIDDLYESYNKLKDLFPKTTFGMQTNLVYRLTPQKRQFMKTVFYENGFGTSWDYDIRFGSINPKAAESQRSLWEKNVKTLIKEDGHSLTMIVSMTKKMIQSLEPIEVIQYAQDLGFDHILFERITSHGNATKNDSIVPSNREQDEWLYRMFCQSLEHKTYNNIGNMLMSELATAYIYGSHTGNRCRSCEQSLITVNADGSISGCPNSAPSQTWGNVDRDVSASLDSEKRAKAIHNEVFGRHQECFTCPAFEYCNSDCQKLDWDEDDSYCPAPKMIWQHMIREQARDEYKKLIIQ